MMADNVSGPHQGQPVRTLGAPLARAHAAMIMLHGRGATAESILLLAEEFQHPDFAYLAPQAAAYTWYPNRFLAPLASNEPWLSSALAAVADTFVMVAAAGIPATRTLLLGFSQGACLALEYAARHARRYGGVVGLSGGLIGADDDPRHDHGDFAGTPIFLGCGEMDFHIPRSRVEKSEKILTALGAAVTMRLYPNMDHTVNQDEIGLVRAMMQALLLPA
ncbi:dienelactone hydrolase family protein [candidate division KSB1 bacterium]|nr:alpha/beta hydrolase [bacterium]NUM64552.1 dienelactone hydrolase family protein [candidate division KSB1 bacterium]